MIRTSRSRTANSPLYGQIPYASTIPAEFATHAALRRGQILRPISLRRLGRTLELLVWLEASGFENIKIAPKVRRGRSSGTGFQVNASKIIWFPQRSRA